MSENRLFLSGEENEKVIRNPRADPDHHQKSITSRGSPSLVDVHFRVRQLSCLQNDRTNERMTENDHITFALLAEVILNNNNNNNKCVSRTDTNSPFAFNIAFSRAQVSRGFYRGHRDGEKRTYAASVAVF